MNDYPFIHVFRVADEYFLYDVNRNNILQIEKSAYEYFKSGEYDCPDGHVQTIIERLKDRGYLSCARIEKIEHPMSTLIHSYLSCKLQSICLQVTQDCNLRCKYCVYSGGYSNRTHNKKEMDFDTAKNAVDFLIAHSMESDTVCIGFYGGEPLLNFDVIKKTVQYVTGRYPGKEYYFALTTNGTVFTDESLAFLEKYKFAITISIDGSREMHNANRKFKNSGAGSFDKVMGYIRKIREQYQGVSEGLMFSVVLSVSSDYMGCHEFFADTDIMKDTELAVSTVSSRYAGHKYSAQREANIIAQRYEIFKCILILIGKLEEDSCSNMVKNYYYKLKEHYKQFYITENEVEPVTHPSGPCIPGAFRLFVNSDGNFYPCEKVSELSEIARIGSLQKGFNFSNIDTILNVGRLGSDMCKNCWAYRYCKLCVSAIDDLTHLSIEKKKECCEKIKKEVEMMMQEYCFISKYHVSREE